MRKFDKKRELQSELSFETRALQRIQSQASTAQRIVSSQEKKVQDLINELEEIETGSSVSVSDHAILRYFERVLGYDLEEIEKKIATEALIEFVETLGGSGRFPVSDFQVCMKNNVVTTVIKNGEDV